MITLLNGETFKEENLLDLMQNDEFYYGYMAKAALSSSSIKTLLSSPKTYKYVLDYGSGESQALRDGWLFHTCILEPHVFEEQIFVDVQSKNTKAYKEALAQHGKVFTAKEKRDAERVADAFLRNEQNIDLAAFQTTFDVFTLESTFYQNKNVEKVLDLLEKNGFSYKKDDATWLNTTEFGDDKDRVMIKSDGSYTYFVPDVAYHLNKWERGFVRVINEQGADHHSTITRVRAGLQGLNLGIPKDWPDYVLHQMVTVTKNNQEVKISKRAGSYVTLRDLIDEVGSDATRYFLLARKPDSQLIFDIDLAKSQTNDNPVYYIQYAHARICAVLNQANVKPEDLQNFDEALLTSTHEHQLIKRLSEFPEIISLSASESSPHYIATFLKDLAADFHSYYNANKFLSDDKALQNARLALIGATKIVIKNGLQLLGISAPEKM